VMKNFFSFVFLFMIPKDYHKGLKLFPDPFGGFCYTWTVFLEHGLFIDSRHKSRTGILKNDGYS